MKVNERDVLEELIKLNKTTRPVSAKKYWEAIKKIQIKEKEQFEAEEKRIQITQETLNRPFTI